MQRLCGMLVLAIIASGSARWGCTFLETASENRDADRNELHSHERSVLFQHAKIDLYDRKHLSMFVVSRIANDDYEYA